jgi:hypothetical protein
LLIKIKCVQHKSEQQPVAPAQKREEIDLGMINLVLLF